MNEGEDGVVVPVVDPDRPGKPGILGESIGKKLLLFALRPPGLSEPVGETGDGTRSNCELEAEAVAFCAYADSGLNSPSVVLAVVGVGTSSTTDIVVGESTNSGGPSELGWWLELELEWGCRFECG